MILFVLRFAGRTHLSQIVPQENQERLISQTSCILCFTSTKTLLQVMQPAVQFYFSKGLATQCPSTSVHMYIVKHIYFSFLLKLFHLSYCFLVLLPFPPSSRLFSFPVFSKSLSCLVSLSHVVSSRHISSLLVTFLLSLLVTSLFFFSLLFSSLLFPSLRFLSLLF